MLSILKNLFGFEKMREINERFRHGKITMTPFSRAVLFVLKIYLLFLVALIVLKFVHTIMGAEL
jgi:hypothetical protein